MRKFIVLFCLISCAANAQTYKTLMVNSVTKQIAYPAQSDIPAFLAANGIASASDVATVGANATNFDLAQGVAQTNDTTLRLAGQGSAITNWVISIIGIQGGVITNAYSAAILSSGAAITNDYTALVSLSTNALDASAINRGTLSDARLSANVPLLNISDTFTGGVVFSGGVTNTQLTASSLVTTDGSKKHTSVPNGVGVLTNNGSGTLSWIPVSSSGAGGTPNVASLPVSSGNVWMDGADPTNIYRITMTANALFQPTNLIDGKAYMVIINAGAGGFYLSLSNNFAFFREVPPLNINGAVTNGPNIDTNTSKITVFKFLSDKNGTTSNLFLGYGSGAPAQ